MSFIALLASENATETHHWLFPETAEIIYGGISSLLVFFGLYKLAGPVAKKAMADRTARIQKELDDAAAAKTSASSSWVPSRSVRKAQPTDTTGAIWPPASGSGTPWSPASTLRAIATPPPPSSPRANANPNPQKTK